MPRVLTLTCAVLAVLLCAAAAAAANSQVIGLGRRSVVSIQDGDVVLAAGVRGAVDARVAALSGMANTAAPLGGRIFSAGTFFVTGYVGSTQQQVRLIFDTGSSDTLISGLAPSSTADPLLCSEDPGCVCDGSKSPPACLFEDAYGDGTVWAGYVVKDTIALSPVLGGKATLGDIVFSHDPHPEPMGIGGIMGMAYTALSSFGEPSPFATFAADGAVEPIFSHCLTSGVGGKPAPSVTYGPGNYSMDEFVTTPLAKDAWYVANVTGMAVGGSVLDVDAHVKFMVNMTIYDSGTTLWLLQEDVFQALWSAMLDMCGTVNLVGVCNSEPPFTFLGDAVILTPEELAMYPTLSVLVANANGGDPISIDVPPSSYMLDVGSTDEGDAYFLGIESSSITILGDVVLRNYHVRYDMGASTVSFGPLSSCPAVGPVPPLPPSPPPSSSSLTTLIIIVAASSVVVLGTVAAVGFFIWRRQARRSYLAIQ